MLNNYWVGATVISLKTLMTEQQFRGKLAWTLLEHLSVDLGRKGWQGYNQQIDTFVACEIRELWKFLVFEMSPDNPHTATVILVSECIWSLDGSSNVQFDLARRKGQSIIILANVENQGCVVQNGAISIPSLLSSCTLASSFPMGANGGKA